MSARISETDLLGLIEGDLPEDRRAPVEAALAADPALGARVTAMRADRSVLRAALRSLAGSPGGLAASAIEAAEREAILGGSAFEIASADIGAGRSGVLARIGGQSRFALAAGLMLVLGGAGLALWTQMGPSQSRDNYFDPSTLAERPGLFEEVEQALAQESAAAAPALAHAEASSPATAGWMVGVDRAVATVASSLQSGAMDAMEAIVALQPRPSNDLSLGDVVETIDKADLDWRRWQEQVLTLAVAGMHRPISRTAEPVPEVTPASYQDALRLAGLDRLTLRIVVDNPARAEQALIQLAASNPECVISLRNSGDACGVATYVVEMPRDERAFAAMLKSLRGCEEQPVKAYFDVALLPPNRGNAWLAGGTLATPTQISGGAPRVSVPVMIVPASAE